MRTFLTIGFVFVLSACSGAAKRPLGEGETAQDLQPNPKVYYSELQIVTETVSEMGCDKSLAKQEIQSPEFKAKANADVLEWDSSESEPLYYVFNVSLQSIGFDNSKHRFSIVDGIVPATAPYPMKIRRRPGNIIHLEFFDQILDLRLNDMPVYSFTATENRDGCKIVHNVNLFAENTAYLKRSVVNP